MNFTKPSVHLISTPSVDLQAIEEYLTKVDGQAWLDHHYDQSECPEDAETLTEFGGKLCYRSWKPGLNQNVTKVRSSTSDYIRNILEQQHGSVTEHAYFVFVFRHVSRVFTHELVRHRVGTSISQESLRYVRLDSLDFWLPEWAQQDHLLREESERFLRSCENFQKFLSLHFNLDDPSAPFSWKKRVTSFMRRFAPQGLATDILWGANIRTLRNVIEQRTSKHAEEEIRLVFDDVARIMLRESPSLFADYTRSDDGEWTTPNRKI